MNITNERLREIVNITVAADRPMVSQVFAERKALAQYALDVRALPDKWRKTGRDDSWNANYDIWGELADELDALREKQND